MGLLRLKLVVGRFRSVAVGSILPMRICRACGSQHTEWFPSGLLSAVERCVRRGRRDSASRGATIHLNLKPRPVKAAHKESANLTLYGAAVVTVSVKKFTVVVVVFDRRRVSDLKTRR